MAGKARTWGRTRIVLAVATLCASCKPAETDGPRAPAASTLVAPPAASSSAQAADARGHRKRKKTRDPSPSPAVAGEDVAKKGVPQNASNADDILILAMGTNCRIEVPPTGPGDDGLPAAASGYEDVDCPDDYDDPAWDECSYILTRDASGCYCLSNDARVRGHATKTSCPVLERKRR